MPVLLEVCVDSPKGLAAAIEGGANRIELCSALELGGLTPVAGLMKAAAAAPIPVYAMIRPHAGPFIFDAADEAAMMADIDAVRAFGLEGVVIGANRPDGTLDMPLIRRLKAHAAGLGSTLHRAFDLVPDADAALEQAVELGFERILTSGCTPKAIGWPGNAEAYLREGCGPNFDHARQRRSPRKRGRNSARDGRPRDPWIVQFAGGKHRSACRRFRLRGAELPTRPMSRSSGRCARRSTSA